MNLPERFWPFVGTFQDRMKRKSSKDSLSALQPRSQLTIAEGFGGNKGRVFQNSLTIARREANESDYWLLLSFEEDYMRKAVHEELESGYREVRAMLSSIISRRRQSGVGSQK